MANNKECAVCKKMMKEKYKHYKFYRIGFFIVLALFVVVLILYCATGDLFKHTENNIEVNNNQNQNIDIENGNNNTINWNNGSYTIS